MIEKLKVVVKPEDWKLPVDELEMRCLKNLLSKVDELVDAVNSLRDDCNLLMGYIAPENKCEPAENGEISKMEKEFAEEELERTRKALKIAIGALKEIQDKGEYVNPIDIATSCLDEITALEQKDVK